MDEKGIDLRDHFPKSLQQLGRVDFDLIINMSGEKLPETLSARSGVGLSTIPSE